MKRPPVRLVIADDHALFRQGLRSVLKLEPEVAVVAEVDRVDELGMILETTPCDILLLDLQMERSTLQDIEAIASRVKVIVVTASERPEEALAAVRRGARAVVLKRLRSRA